MYPSKLLFFCEHAAETGGATPLCRSDVLYEQLAERCPEFLQACEEKGLRYTNVMPSQDDPASGMGRSWQRTFRRETREEAEARMSQLGYRWEWLDDGCLRATTPRLPAFREVSPGRKTFFNQLIAAFQGWQDSRNDPAKAITLGDGSPLDRDAVILAADMAEALTFDVPWQAGDVAMVDNYVVMHGRRTFTGKRKILASLVAAESVIGVV
ncbi:MAG: TauD/TfdA family dioxygenase [Planctomycetota bacterium]|nr:TauD/TfdA family dioxygenase [Planctomycetota bacterium]